MFFFVVLGEDDSYMFLVLVTSCRSIGKIKNSEITCINSTIFISLGNYDDACILEVQKLLNSGSFYFTTLSQKTNDSEKPLDLSLTYQRQCSVDEPDNRFFWYVNTFICTSHNTFNFNSGTLQHCDL